MNGSDINTDLPNVDTPEIADNDPPLKTIERIKLFLFASWRGVVCLVTPIIFTPLLIPFPPEKWQWCAYTLALMAIYWVTECIHLTITSFLPIVIFPMVGVMNTMTTCRCYINDTIVMFFGSMALAYSVEQSGLHKRLALGAIRTIGYSHYRLLLAMCLTTMFVSMWITNTAATTMMVPIIFALLKVFEDQNLLSVYETSESGEKIASDMTTCYFCAATFSATIGGIGTLVGTATNLTFKGLFERTYPDADDYLSFPKFSAFAIPYMIIMEIALYIILLYKYIGFLNPKSKEAKSAKISAEGQKAAKEAVELSWKELGNVTFWEIMVIILFAGAMIMFFCRSPQVFYGWGDLLCEYFGLDDRQFVRDSAAAMLIIFLMLLLPSTLDFFKHFTAKEGELPNKPVPSVLHWFVMNEIMPYGFLFLLGGGFALSQAAKKEYSDLNGRIGDMMKHLKPLPNYFIIFLIITFTVFITNFTSNVVVATVVVPMVMEMAREIDIHPLWYNIAAGFSASYCFCLPVGTPGNLIVQSAANISTPKMIKAGAVPSVVVIALTWVAMCFWAPIVWPELNYTIVNVTAFQ